MSKNKKKSKQKKSVDIKRIKDSVDKTQTIKIAKNIMKSRVNKNEHLYTEENNPDVRPITEDLTLTKQQKFNFDDNNLEDEIDNSKKKPRKDTVISIKKELLETEKQKNKYKNKFHIFFFLFIILVIGLTISIYYDINYEPKMVTKEVEKKVVDENIVFLGDSLTYRYDLDKYYEEYNTVNSGIDGNTTEDILNNMKERVYKYNPSKVILLIGTNDINMGIKEENTISNIKNIIKNIKKYRPYTKIYVESLYPINNTDYDKISNKTVGVRKNEIIKKYNNEIKKCCEENDCSYINMYDLLIDEDGNLKLEYTKEGLHISEEGYEVITKKLKTYL